MSNLALVIGGREYTVACAAGEEAHVRQLGRLIDEKLQSLPGGAGQGESRSLLFAALLLADELHELRNRQPAAQGAPEISALEAIATRLEKLAISLETEAHSA